MGRMAGQPAGIGRIIDACVGVPPVDPAASSIHKLPRYILYRTTSHSEPASLSNDCIDSLLLSAPRCVNCLSYPSSERETSPIEHVLLMMENS